MNMHRRIAWIPIVAVLVACSPQRLVVNQMVAVFENGMQAMERDDDSELLGRAFPAHIKQMEGMLASAPDNRRLLVLLAKAYAAYGYVYWDPEFEALRLTGRAAADRAQTLQRRLDRYYHKGMDYALQALAVRHPEAPRRLATTTGAAALMTDLTEADVPALFWYGFNLSAYVNVNMGSVRALAKGHLVEKAMERVLELEETYFHGTAHLVLLAYHGARSAATGADSDRAPRHYRRLQEITRGRLWLADLYWARYVAYPQQDRRQFTTLLRAIVDRPESAAAYRLLNHSARQRARIYLEAADRLFLEP